MLVKQYMSYYNGAMQLREVVQYLNSLLPLEEVARSDYSLNGLQVGALDAEVSKAAFAVDACMASFERAAQSGAQLLCVHHGLFWGKPIAVTGEHYRRIKFLLENGIALYAAHLPLDMESTLGNNAGIADRLNLQQRQPFGDYHGVKIGVKGVLPAEATVEEILSSLELSRESALGVLPFGPDTIRTLGIISGGADKEVGQALEEGLDLYITGELNHQVYHTCLEGGINLISAGHYNTEVYGVQSLMEKVSTDKGLAVQFVDVPTGL